MLVLSRKQQESIQISDNIVVTILGIQGTTVRIGIDAPKDIRVLRTELQNHNFASPRPNTGKRAPPKPRFEWNDEAHHAVD